MAEDNMVGFISLVSHELRSPMTPIKVQLQLLEKGYLGKLTDKQRIGVDILVRNIDRLDLLLVDFLDVSRIEASRLVVTNEEFDIKPIVEEVFKKLGDDVKVIWSIREASKMKNDPARVGQIIRKIFGCIRYFIEKVSIEITESSGKEIMFSIPLSGLTEQDCIDFFKPFYFVRRSADKKFPGSGLELSISKGIAETLGGKMWVEKATLPDATLRFLIPVVPMKKVIPAHII